VAPQLNALLAESVAVWPKPKAPLEETNFLKSAVGDIRI
jgi:hypothetical protein